MDGPRYRVKLGSGRINRSRLESARDAERFGGRPLDMACVATYVKHMRRPLPEKMLATFPPGTFQRIEAVSAADEDRTAFVRSAVRQELERREAVHQREPAKQLAKTSAGR